MSNYEFGAGIWMFQQFVDRYATDAYGPPVSTLEAIERAAAVGDIKVLDINYPFAGEDVTIAQVREALQRTGLRAQAITPHLYMREFQLGSFTNPDPAVRHKAVDLGKQATLVAHQLDHQSLFGREMPADGAHADPGPSCHLLDLDLDPVVGEQRFGRRQDPFTVAAGVGPHGSVGDRRHPRGP